MNDPHPWHDPVVAEIHAVRQKLAEQYGNDLTAYSKAAEAHCRSLGFEFAPSPRRRTPQDAADRHDRE